jgi:hypothetical protein
MNYETWSIRLPQHPENLSSRENKTDKIDTLRYLFTLGTNNKYPHFLQIVHSCLFAGRASAALLIALGEPQLKIKTPPLSS